MTGQTAVTTRPPLAPTLRAQAAHFVELWLGAMFLRPQVYGYMRDRKNPAANGATYVAVIGVLTALASILGAGMRFASSPSAAAVKNTVLTHLQQMPFYTQNPGIARAFEQGYQQVWNTAGSLFMGYPTDGAGVVQLLLNILINPIVLLLGWLVYAALVHLVGRGWNRETSYGELLGPLALAASPHLIHLFDILPGGTVSGAVILVWSLLLNIFAVKAAYQTTTRRAAWGALFPVLVLFIVLVVLCALGLLVALSALAALRGGQ